MAAIIAQMTRQNRERKRKKRVEISKCMYEIPPFADSFNPELHNKYRRARNTLKEKRDAEEFYRSVIKRLDDLKEEGNKQAQETFHFRTFITEASIIIGSLSLVPALTVIILLFWPNVD